MLKKVKKENEYSKKTLELMLFCKMAERITTADYAVVEKREGNLLKVGYCKKLFGSYSMYIGQKTKKDVHIVSRQQAAFFGCKKDGEKMIKNQMSRTSYFKRRQKIYITIKKNLQLNIAKNKACYLGGFIAMLKIK